MTSGMPPPLFALEKYFCNIASKRTEEFPGSGNYWEHYSGLLNVLREAFYPVINVELAVNSGSIAGVYTDHSGEHFDEVVKYAGKLTGADVDPTADNFALRPFEVFLLLMAIRLHDVGNLFGRDGHEKKALNVYKQSTPSASRDKFETQAITKIAEVHGGYSTLGNKDTISQLKEVDHLGSSNPFRPRLVAALVRLADEVCEHRGRVKQHLIDSGLIPADNLIFHLYAAAIKSSVVDRREKLIRIEYVLHKKNLLTRYSHFLAPEKGKFLLDETLDRLGKLNQERIYCNQFLDPPLQINRIHASITIVDGDDDESTIDVLEIDIKPEGYPADDVAWRSQARGFSGGEIKDRLSQDESVKA